MSDNRNLLLAIVLSVAVLGGWEYFYGMPQREKAQQIAEQNRIEQSVAVASKTNPAAGAQPNATAHGM